MFWWLSFYIWYLVGHPSPLSFSKKFWQFLCIFSSRWTLESTCQVPLKIPLGFWLEVHWIYRLIWGELTSLHYWIFPSRNMVCLSISSGVLLCPLVNFIGFFFFSCRSYIFLVRFIPGYFVVFVVTVNYIFSSILHFIFQLVIASI